MFLLITAAAFFCDVLKGERIDIGEQVKKRWRARKKERGEQQSFNSRHEGKGVGKEGNIALIESLVLGSRSPLNHLRVLGNRVAEFGQGDRLIDDRHQGRRFWLGCKVLNCIRGADIGQRELFGTEGGRSC